MIYTDLFGGNKGEVEEAEANKYKLGVFT